MLKLGGYKMKKSKKKIIPIIILALLFIFALGLSACSGFGGSNNNASENIDIEEAKSIAVTDAGFTLDQVTITQSELDRDDGRMEFEIEFYVDDMEYSYTINAETGAIIESDKELREIFN